MLVACFFFCGGGGLLVAYVWRSLLGRVLPSEMVCPRLTGLSPLNGEVSAGCLAWVTVATYKDEHPRIGKDKPPKKQPTWPTLW